MLLLIEKPCSTLSGIFFCLVRKQVVQGLLVSSHRTLEQKACMTTSLLLFKQEAAFGDLLLGLGHACLRWNKTGQSCLDALQ
jgi:hypothetical protein